MSINLTYGLGRHAGPIYDAIKSGELAKLIGPTLVVKAMSPDMDYIGGSVRLWLDTAKLEFLPFDTSDQTNPGLRFSTSTTRFATAHPGLHEELGNHPFCSGKLYRGTYGGYVKLLTTSQDLWLDHMCRAWG